MDSFLNYRIYYKCHVKSFISNQHIPSFLRLTLRPQNILNANTHCMKSCYCIGTILCDHYRFVEAFPPLCEVEINLSFYVFRMSVVYIPSIISVYTNNIDVLDLKMECISFYPQYYIH